MICDECDNDANNTLRAKTGPGQWQMLAKVCEEHLTSTINRVRTENASIANTIQVIPFSKKDWPETVIQ